MEEILVEVVTEKSGTTADGRDWTRYAIKDANGAWYSTFDQQLVAKLEQGKKARIQYESKPLNGRVVKNLTAAELVEESPISSRTEEGETDWDLIGLRKTRCALWAGLLGGLSSSLYAGSKGDMGFLQRNAVILVAAAEKDIFERPAGDDGFPFDPADVPI